MQSRLDFIQEYNRIWRELVNLLDINTVKSPEQNPMERRICERFAVIRKMAMNENNRAGLRLARLGTLSENLHTLKEHRPQIFTDFKSGFHEIEHDRYFGWRCEVDTAAYLTRNDIEYAHPDPPDFHIETPDGEFSIECTSAHFQGSQRDVEEKIKDAVSKKSDKDYFNPSTALFIDVTNIYYTAIQRGEGLSSSALKSWVRERIDILDLDIGCVLLIGYQGDLNEFRLKYSSDRIDNSPSDELSTFLNEQFPFGETDSRLRWFPPEA